MKCAVEACERQAKNRQWCHGHYESWRRTGVEPTEPFLDTPEKRFWAKVDKRPDGCWIWTGSTDGRGRYGSFQYRGRVWRAHRAAYAMLVADPPADCDLDHLCRVTLCVNPAHLEPVTHRENVLRGENFSAINAAKVECLRGHDLTDPDNIYRAKGGGRQCQACRSVRNATRSWARHAAGRCVGDRRCQFCAGSPAPTDVEATR